MTPRQSGPVRTCVGCRARLAQDRLVRLHVDDRDRLRLDRHGAGRGAWLCAATKGRCLERAIEGRAIDRAMRRRVDRASMHALVAELAGRSKSDTVS